jgi:hypothetical protein
VAGLTPAVQQDHRRIGVVAGRVGDEPIAVSSGELDHAMRKSSIDRI